MDNILKNIIEVKRTEVEAAKNLVPIERLIELAHCSPHKPLSMSKALTDNPVGIIAEFKRRSPSKGDIHPLAQSSEVVPEYQRNGAAACSVLTDTTFFGGALTDLMVARATATLPLLRKEFIIDHYQIYQARIAGADSILLIAAALTPQQVGCLAETAHACGLEVLLEVHSEKELGHYCPGIEMIGVNNRNLETFKTDVNTSIALAAQLPSQAVHVAESGLRSLAEVAMLRQHGYRGFLIGETFMKTTNPGKTLKDFITAK